jgi:hypothetical protein
LQGSEGSVRFSRSSAGTRHSAPGRDQPNPVRRLCAHGGRSAEWWRNDRADITTPQREVRLWAGVRTRARQDRVKWDALRTMPDGWDLVQKKRWNARAFHPTLALALQKRKFVRW